jgi:uncharacterized protein DUF6559
MTIGKGNDLGLLRRWQMRRAAKQYARRLGPHLQRAYGAAEHYSAPQIRAGVAKLGLDPRFITVGYAAFLPEDQYASSAHNAPIPLSYPHARELFERFRPSKSFGTSNYYESGLGMVGGPNPAGDGGSP